MPMMTMMMSLLLAAVFESFLHILFFEQNGFPSSVVKLQAVDGLDSSTSKDFPITYEGKIWSLHTVTFGQKN